MLQHSLRILRASVQGGGYIRVGEPPCTKTEPSPNLTLGWPSPFPPGSAKSVSTRCGGGVIVGRMLRSASYAPGEHEISLLPVNWREGTRFISIGGWGTLLVDRGVLWRLCLLGREYRLSARPRLHHTRQETTPYRPTWGVIVNYN